MKNIFQNKHIRNLTYISLLTIPIALFVFKFSVLYRHGVFQGEDWDYFAQSYEAARQTILHYHQFPWWNSWSLGGVPLFANPQFGLFSIQMLLVLIFGTVSGLHLSVLVYMAIGFWGMYVLLSRLGAKSKIVIASLSYIWVFSGFTTWHIFSGHLTFTTYFLCPWLFMSVLNIHKKYSWIWFALIASIMIQSAAHYITIEALLIAALIAIAQLCLVGYRRRALRPKHLFTLIRPYLLSVAAILIICGPRLFYTFEFLHDYPRLQPLDPPSSLSLLTASLAFRHPANPSTLSASGSAPYLWTEYANYFGLITLGLFAYLLFRSMESIRKIELKDWLLLLGIALSAIIALGAFSRVSPYAILHHLPIFDQMRVPSRFVCWISLGVILFLHKMPRKPVLYVLLIISVIDVFVANYPALSYTQKPYIENQHKSENFEQYSFFDTTPELGQAGIGSLQNLRLLRATQQNFGEVYGYEPILNAGEYYFSPGTIRCGINQGCKFVLTNNARVVSWSPHAIRLQRTGNGPIKLNMNPGKSWRVNNEPIFKDYQVLELGKEFVINSSQQNITVSFKP